MKWTERRCTPRNSGSPARRATASATRNPERAAKRVCGRTSTFWKKPAAPEFQKTLKHTQFADFHSHGWIFRAVYKKDRHGNLLDEKNNIVRFDDPEKFGKAVHLQDIHLEKGMHCTDCHFTQDAHGNGKLYGETRNAVEIDCVDCHGKVNARATLTTSGPAAPAGEQILSYCELPGDNANSTEATIGFFSAPC